MPSTAELEQAVVDAQAQVDALIHRRRTSTFGTWEQYPAEMAEAQAALSRAEEALTAP